MKFVQFSKNDPTDYSKRADRDIQRSNPPPNAPAVVADALERAADWRKSVAIYPDEGSKKIAAGLVKEAREVRETAQQSNLWQQTIEIGRQQRQEDAQDQQQDVREQDIQHQEPSL